MSGACCKSVNAGKAVKCASTAKAGCQIQSVYLCGHQQKLQADAQRKPKLTSNESVAATCSLLFKLAYKQPCMRLLGTALTYNVLMAFCAIIS